MVENAIYGTRQGAAIDTGMASGMPVAMRQADYRHLASADVEYAGETMPGLVDSTLSYVPPARHTSGQGFYIEEIYGGPPPLVSAGSAVVRLSARVATSWPSACCLCLT
jgi:hypothetical protein